MNIHPTALIHDGAQLDSDVTIDAFSIIGPHAQVDSGTRIGSHCVITGHTHIGKDNVIGHHVVLGAPPQDLKYKGEPTRLEIGDRNTIREFVTMNVGTATGTSLTKVGNDNLFMCYSHVAHDCRVGNSTVFANNATLAGHVHIDNNTVIGGLSAFHQFTRMGKFAIVGGCSAVTQDVPPFSLVTGNRARLYGLNLIGLRRNGFSSDTISALKKAIKYLMGTTYNTSQAIELIQNELSSVPEVLELVAFVKSSKRGICKA